HGATVTPDENILIRGHPLTMKRMKDGSMNACFP
ncbi:hypothetical protein A2U01_0066494, partial [Trifolium medium]|nr:hypothetical protein [Trifolium medium]